MPGTDFGLIRGSTYLHEGFDFSAAIKTLKSIDGNVAIVGLGAQNPTLDIKYLDDCAEAKIFISILNEKSKSISVRGNFSAAVVERLGGKNVRVTGCPSLFYKLESPLVTVPTMLLRKERAVGLSIHTGLSNNVFCRSPSNALKMHSQLLGYALRNSAVVSVFEQGVIDEFWISDRSRDFRRRLECAVAVHERTFGEEFYSPYELIAHMVSVRSLDDWILKSSDLDALIGFRFHGNMIGLLQGIPCFYYTYDSRMKEFCDLYQLPSQDVDKLFSDPFARIISHDWEKANTAFQSCFLELTNFYKENGIDHNLVKY